MTQESVEGFRLSPQQLRLWLLQEQDGNGAYRTRAAIRITGGSADPDRLREAFNDLAQRHEILRTTFRRLPDMGVPLQVVGDRSAGRFEFENGVHAEAFELADGPVWSVSIQRTHGDAEWVHLDLPALCADRPTLDRIVVELAALYDAKLADRVNDVEPLQYADLAEWWNELLDKPESAAGIEYWRRLDIGGALNQRLPFERSREAAGRFRPARTALAADPALAERVEGLSRETATDVRTVLLTCWQVLLQRLLGERTLILGYATSGRRLKELQSALGPCARTLPLIASLDDDPSFREAVSRSGVRVQEQEKWEDLFTWESQRRSGTERPSGIPELPYGFGFERREVAMGRTLTFSLEDAHAVTDRFALRLDASEEASGLRLALEFDEARVSEKDARRLLERFTQTIESAASDPSRRVGSIDILLAGERRKLFVDWNDTGREFAHRRPIHERFEEAVARWPASTALTGDGLRLTFGEVNDRANRVARRLRAAGVAPDVLVGLGLERSIDMIVGLLAIWKAGGAYVPLDPALPLERLAFLMEDTCTKFLVTRATLASRFPAGIARIFEIDEHGEESSENLEPAAGPEDLAYVIFTSGSTGKPKGVSVEHRQIANYVNAILERLDPAPGASFATVTTLAADLGNTSIFPALATGGRLHVVSEQTSADPEALADELSHEPVDYMKIVPSHLSALLSATRPESILPRRCVILGGEASNGELVARIRRVSPGCEIVNHYGPTEATIGATAFRIPPDFPGEPTMPVPIGRPLANCRVYLLDSRGAPAPLGSPGELHIAGAGLARGYLNRPGLTSERFFEMTLGVRRERLYRTGDLARYRDDGELEILGRTDDQLKHHGFRIEPGEIEATLSEHVSVARAIVLPRELPGTGRRLIAWVVPRPGESISAPGLRDFLTGKLPDYMVPSMFVPLPRVPLTANGKIDRAALPMPDGSRNDETESLVSPRTPQEKVLVKVWADVLRIDRLGIHDNFFELGGDSILAIQIIARAAREGLRLTPRQLFERQTVAELASVAVGSPTKHNDQGLITGPVPLTPVQHWFFERRLRAPHHFNQSVILESSDRLDPATVQATLELLARHHDALRLRFDLVEQSWQQKSGESGGDWPLLVVASPADELAGNEALAESVDRAQSSLDLASGPLARAVLSEDDAGGLSRLLLVVHHLVVDTVSWQILLEDFDAAYRALSSGIPVALPPKTTSFRRWAEALVELARGGDVARESDYWLSRLQAWTPLVPAEANGENTVGSARSVTSRFSKEETQSILQEIPAAFRTHINDALLTALAMAFLAKGGSPLVIELEGHGREDIIPGIDLSRTVGWLTARFPVRLEISPTASAGENLAAVKEQLREIPGRGLGFGLLRYLSPTGFSQGAGWSSLPEPDVSFNYLGRVDQAMPDSPGIRRRPSIGNTRSPQDRRAHALAIEGKVLDGCLQFSWIYSEARNRRGTIETLAGAFATAMRELVAQSRSSEPRRYTPADFPKARLSQKDIDRLVAGVPAGDSKAPR